MKVYYAHCTAIYGTPQEDRDLELLRTLFGFGAEVINPSSHMIAKQCNAIKADVNEYNMLHEKHAYDSHWTRRDASNEIMLNIFRPLVKSVDVVAFRALPDGRIPAGVFKEITWAEEAGVPVIELPSNTLGREMTVPHTRQYLKEIGQR